MISDRAQKLGESATLKMARLANELKEEGKNIISLSLGEPDFNTPDFIKDSIKQAVDDNHSFYTPVPGTLKLREAVSHKFKRDNNINYSPEQIVVSTGAKQSVMNIILATVNPEDEVILPAPYWVSYLDMVNFAEGKVVEIPTTIDEDYKIDAKSLERAISEKSKVFLFSNPCNPSGSSYTHAELESLVRVFEKHPKLLIVSDEIYEYINFTHPHTSMAAFETIADRVITVNGLSKAYAMTGYRLGYMGAPTKIAKACSKIQGQFTSGANAVTQAAAIAALDSGDAKIAYMKEKFSKRRDCLILELSKIKGIKLNKPQGAFYLLPDISSFFGKSYQNELIQNSQDFSELLLRQFYVAVTAGSAFGAPQTIRISYAVNEDFLIEAAERISRFCSEIR